MAEAEAPAVDLAAQLAEVTLAKQELEDKTVLLTEERDNYKTVALKRKGKLDNDENFFGEHDEADIEKTVGERVSFKQREIDAQRKIDAAERDKVKAETALAELLRAKDNKPGESIGTAAAGGQEVKDAIFSEAQMTQLSNKWTRMGFNEEQQKRMLETERKNAVARRSL